MSPVPCFNTLSTNGSVAFVVLLRFSAHSGTGGATVIVAQGHDAVLNLSSNIMKVRQVIDGKMFIRVLFLADVYVELLENGWVVRVSS